MSIRSREWFDDFMKGDPGREVVVFTEALKVPAQERAAFLDRACAGDENLRHKVEALLGAHDRLGDFLEEPPTGTSVE
jgi:hypothetical protein